MKRTKDKIRAAQCPGCGWFMNKTGGQNDGGKPVYTWRCKNPKCKSNGKTQTTPMRQEDL